MAGSRVDLRALKRSTMSTWLGLVAGSWVGLAWGSLLSAPVGIGFGVAVGSIFGGFLAVPLWGTAWGLIGLGRQRENAVRRHGITLLDQDDPLAQRVYGLAGRVGLSTRPWVGVMSHTNAYAVGASADNAMVVVGRPLLSNLSESEVDAVIGHELGHIANNDMRRMGLARSFQNSLVWYLGFSDTVQGWGKWLLTWLSELLVLKLSRRREYWADAIGAALTSKEDMIGALDKLHAVPDLDQFERHHARLMIRGFGGRSLFSTHPTLEDRKAVLMGEIYLKLIPVLPALEPPDKPPAAVIRVEDIAYARR